MSLRQRLINIARAEIRGAARRIRRTRDEVFGHTPLEPGANPEIESRPGSAKKGPRGDTSSRGETGNRPRERDEGESARIRGFYANLELPIGASVAEVKAAYRRLMRRYHPDLHQGDSERAEVAHKLAQELRTAYEGLLAHLGRHSE